MQRAVRGDQAVRSADQPEPGVPERPHLQDRVILGEHLGLAAVRHISRCSSLDDATLKGDAFPGEIGVERAKQRRSVKLTAVGQPEGIGAPQVADDVRL